MSSNSDFIDFINDLFGGAFDAYKQTGQYRNDLFGGAFDAYKQTGQYRDQGMMDIALRRKEYEKHLNEMWRIYSTGNVKQIVEYNKQVEEIKSYGYKVMRNDAGIHKLVLRDK